MTAVFAANGLLRVSLAARTPSLQQDLDFSATSIGVISAIFGLTAVAAMQTTGGLAARFGSEAAMRWLTSPLPILLIGIGFAPYFFGDHRAPRGARREHERPGRGSGTGAEAAHHEQLSHGRSVGAVAGAVLGAIAAQVGLSGAWHECGARCGFGAGGARREGCLAPAEARRGGAPAAGSLWSAWRT